MSNGHKLSGSGSNQSPPKIFSPGTVSSDSSSALTEENVKRLEKKYTTSKEAFNKKRIQDYIKQSNLALSCNEKIVNTSTELVWDEEPEGATSSFPAKQKENSKEDCQRTYAVISGKDKLLTDAAMLPGGTEIFSEAEVSEGSTESKEEPGEEEEGENSPTEQCDQAVCEPAESHRSPSVESEEESSSSREEQEDNGTAADPCTAQIFCCRSYKNVFNAAIQDLMSEDQAENETDSAPHTDDLQAELQRNIKEKVLQQLGEGGFKNSRQILQLYLKFVSRNRISFRLSKPNNYTIRPKTDPLTKHQPESSPPEDLLEMDRDFVAEHLKVGMELKLFMLLFSYPSGNIAILIAFTEEAQFTYVILEDHRHPGIRAAFGSRGHGVSFHSNGHPRTILSPCTGICFDQAGSRQKHWNWHDLSHHVHSPPFQPITMKLNSHLTLKIVAQDKIHLWFVCHNNCIHFNLGSRLKLKDPARSHQLKGLESEEEQFLQSKKTQLRSLLSKIESVLQQFGQSQPQ
ncbi:UNVERIFIED_CONTAM: hypothetical protein H355_000995 [Colinus virginianus]|nr:hypothetical protein H355_000995 [Colinus virginianus]